MSLRSETRSPGDTIRAPRGVCFFVLNEPGIPHEIGEAAELRSTLAEECSEWSRVMLALASEQAVVLPELRDGEWRTATEQSACRDEADERSRRERATAEPEDVELVCLLQGSGVLEVLDQPVVCGANVGLEAEAESTAGDLVERSGADAFEIELELSDRVRVERVVPAFSGQPKVMQNVGRIVSIVPGAIETQRQPPDRCH